MCIDLRAKNLGKNPNGQEFTKKNVCASEKEMTDAGKAERVSRMFLSNTQSRRKEERVNNSKLEKFRPISLKGEYIYFNPNNFTI